MKLKLPRRLVAIGLLALGIGLGTGGIALWQRMPDPRTREIERIRRRVFDLAGDLTFVEADGNFARLAYPDHVASYFADPIELEIAAGQRSRSGTMTRAQLREGTAATRASYRGLKVQFLDPVVDLPRPALAPEAIPDRATVHLTSTIYLKGDPDYWIQEFRLELVKTNAEWLVRRIETVETMTK